MLLATGPVQGELQVPLPKGLVLLQPSAAGPRNHTAVRSHIWLARGLFLQQTWSVYFKTNLVRRYTWFEDLFQFLEAASMALRSRCAPVSCLSAELGPSTSRLSSPRSWLKDSCELTLCFTAEFFSCHQGPLTFQALKYGSKRCNCLF